MTDLVNTKGLVRLIDYKEAWAEVSGGDPLSSQVSLFSTKTFSHQHKELLNDFIPYWRSAVQNVQENPQKIAQQFSDLLSMPASVVEPAIWNTLFVVPGRRGSPEEIYCDVKGKILKNSRMCF